MSAASDFFRFRFWDLLSGELLRLTEGGFIIGTDSNVVSRLVHSRYVCVFFGGERRLDARMDYNARRVMGRV